VSREEPMKYSASSFQEPTKALTNCRINPSLIRRKFLIEAECRIRRMKLFKDSTMKELT
jgi:hypothetical protein